MNVVKLLPKSIWANAALICLPFPNYNKIKYTSLVKAKYFGLSK